MLLWRAIVSVGREQAAAEGCFENSAHKIASAIEAEELEEAAYETAVRHVLESFLLFGLIWE